MDRQLTAQNQQGQQVSGVGQNSKELTSDEFCLLWGRLIAAYPKNDTTELTIEVYYESLSAYEREPVLEAIKDCLVSCKWFPTISEIVERIKSPRGCIHRLILADIDRKKSILEYSERQFEERKQYLAEECAVLESKSRDLYKRDREMIEQSGLPEAQAKLGAMNEKIKDAEHTLAMVRRKVKLLDQARILQEQES